MATFTLQTVQKIPIGLEKAWAFFSDPKNLPVLTPPDMGFTITSVIAGTEMYAGQIIEYRVKPLWGIPVYWMTEITHVREGSYFIDEQRFGPYQLWHHQHHFRIIQGGVEMSDIVYYRLPFGFLGRMANRLLVKNRLRKIFEFRFQKIEGLFGPWKEEDSPGNRSRKEPELA